MGFIFGNHRRNGCFRACACCSRHCINSWNGMQHPQQSLHPPHRFMRPNNTGANHFGAIHGGASAKSNHCLASMLTIQRYAFLHLHIRRIRGYSIIPVSYTHLAGIQPIHQLLNGFGLIARRFIFGNKFKIWHRSTSISV